MDLFLDIVVFGKSKKALAEALEHAAQQLRMGTPSESITWENAHVTFDIAKVAGNERLQNKRTAYLGD